MPFRLEQANLSEPLSSSPWIDLGFDEPVGALAHAAATLGHLRLLVFNLLPEAEAEELASYVAAILRAAGGAAEEG